MRWKGFLLAPACFVSACQMFRFLEWRSCLFTGSRPKAHKGPMALRNLYNSLTPHTPPAHWLFTSFVGPFAQYHATGLGERPHGNGHQALGFGVKAAPSSSHIPSIWLVRSTLGRINETLMMIFPPNGPHKAGGRPRDMTLLWTTQPTLHPLCQHPQNLQSPHSISPPPPPLNLPLSSPCPGCHPSANLPVHGEFPALFIPLSFPQGLPGPARCLASRGTLCCSPSSTWDK